MDPNGGITPSAPRLDNTPPQPDPVQPPPAPQFIDQPTPMGPSIPPEMPSSGPAMQDPYAQPDPMFAAPQFQDPSAQYSVPPQIDPDPMLSQPMADPGVPAQGGGKKKPLMILLSAILGIGLIGGAGFAGYTMGKEAGKQEAAAEFQQQQATEQEAATSQDQTQDVQLELGELTELNPKEESLKGTIGEQIDASDGFVLYVTNIERNFATNDTSYQLDDGKELVKVNFLMGNTTKDRPKDIKSADLYLEEKDGTKITPESRLSDYEGNFDTVTIEPGNQASGSIVFAVKKDAAPLVFVREQRYRITNQNKEVTTKISITVAE